MVLLRGENYDYSGQQKSFLTTAPSAADEALIVENTAGFADDDYIIIAPSTERTEIVRVNAAVSSDTSITITALKFAHYVKDEIFRTNYNQMKFYECATATGTYVDIASSTTEMDYSTNFTNYDDPTATADYYYKRTFINETTAAESDIALSQYWQIDDEDLYATPEELRMFLQFDEQDYPSESDMRFFIKIAQSRITLDVSSSDTTVLFISTLLLSKYYVLRGLATKSVAKGYIQVMAEGRTITKAYQELVLESENVYQEYKEFILSTGRQEVTKTNFMDDTTMIDSWTRADIIGLMNGQTDAVDFQQDYRFSYFGRNRRS